MNSQVPAVVISIIALAVEQGHDFRVVWVCTPEEYDRAQETGVEPRSIPWPYSALRILDRTRDEVT